MINIIIIDDEDLAIFHLTNLLKKITSLELKLSGVAKNLDEGVELIKVVQPDVVFLDINMPGKNGLEIFNVLKFPRTKIIFVTSYPQYALDAFKNSAFDYLLKPLNIIDLQESLHKVSSALEEEQHVLELEDKISRIFPPAIEGKNIILEVGSGFIMENTKNIEYCYASQSYSTIVTYVKKEILVSKSLKELQELLPENQFYRTHKSYLVNIHYIRKFVHAKENWLQLKSGAKIPVSVRNSTSIMKDVNKMLAGQH